MMRQYQSKPFETLSTQKQPSHAPRRTLLLQRK
jgi:hypothetical protein